MEPIECECTGTVFHLYSEEAGITARCANPECGLWLDADWETPAAVTPGAPSA